MELNREQIVKALEWCSSGRNCMKCSEDERSPRLSKEGCMALQMRNALALIRELTVELDAMRGAANSYKMHYEAAKADTVRKMQEAVLEMFPSDKEYTTISRRTVKRIAKEMLEEE